MQLTNIRWKRWLVGLAGLLGAYTLAGFWLLPLALKSEIPRYVQTELGRQATIGTLSFNPYTLRLQAQDLRLVEADGAALFAIGQLDVQLQWQSVIRRVWSFAEIRIAAPSANLAIAADGKFNVAELLAAFKRQPPEAATDAGLPPLTIARFALEQGKLVLQDRQAGYDNSFSTIGFELGNFSTLADQTGTYTLSAESKHGGKLRWKGEASVNPLRGSGELTLEDVSLSQLTAYLKSYTDVTLASGQLSATLPYQFSYAGGKFDLSLAQARAAVRGLALTRTHAQDAFASLSLLEASQISADLARRQLTVGALRADSASLALANASKAPLRLAQLGFSDGSIDFAARRVSVGRLYAQGGQMQVTRERNGKLDILSRLPSLGASATAPAKSGAPWKVVAKRVELSKFAAELADQGAGIKTQVQDFAVKLEGLSSDLAQPVQFNGGLSLRSGGQLSARGSLVPKTGALKADVQVRQLALAPLQPLLDKYLKLKIAGGSVSAQGRLTAGETGKRRAALRYAGAVDIANLKLNEEDGELFAQWKSLSATQLSASLNPHSLVIPELRLIDPFATLIIEDDRSFNATRLLVRPATADVSAKPAQAPPASQDPLAVRIQRLRVQNAKLDFTDLSLRPQFSAKVYELSGLVNGLSSKRDARSQIELEGRVDEFGLARVSGELNPFAPRDNTNLSVVFKNVDMVAVSPYAMKFAGYRIAEGKISLDLQYKLRSSQLEGANQIVIDKLTLGERVDSPDAFKLPLELAIAILKDSDGRINLGLPVSGNMDDPQFSYGAVVHKAIGNMLTKIVTAPFRALGSLFGVSGDKLEAIDFDPGSDRLLPPEREKLRQVAQVLSKRTQLKLLVPGQYSEVADGAALKARAVRFEIASRAGIKLEAGEEPGPLSIGDRAVRVALRDMYAERFGVAELEKQKNAAQELASEPATAGAKTETMGGKLPVWQRVGKLIQGEPQVADASSFYLKLQERLDQSQTLAANALTGLGAQRAIATLAALRQAGVDPANMIAAAPENVNSGTGKTVPLKLGLTTK